MKDMYRTLLICLLLFPSFIFAEGKLIHIEEGFTKINSNTYSEFLFDESSKLTIEKVANLQIENWSPMGNISPSFGYIPQAVWLKFQVKFGEPAEGLYFLRVNYPSLDSVKLYIIDNATGDLIYEKEQGDNFKFIERILPSHVFQFPIVPIENASWTFYIRSQTTASLSVPIEIFSPYEFYSEETNVYLLFGFYFGLILTMFFYNLVVYFYTKDNVFIFYLFYLVSYFFMVFSGFGFGSRFLYPNSIFLNNNLFVFSVAFNAAASILFSAIFLRIKEFFPRFYSFLLFVIGMIVIWFFVYLATSMQILYNFIGIISFIPQISILFVAVFLFKKYQYARYFVFAWSFYLVMYGISVLRLMGFIPTNHFTYYGVQIGSAVEMLVLSFAIGRKLYDYKLKSDRLTQDAIEQKKRINLELTKLVEEKTKVISNNYKLIEKDIEMARNMQLSTLPKNVDLSKYNLELASFFLPKDRVSGDIYDVCNFDEDRIRIFIADATGHGIQAGFFTMSIRTEYERIKYQHSDTSQVLRMLNQSVFQTFGNETMLYSCFLIDIDLSQKYFEYSSAGHPEQFLYQNNELIELKSLGPILGFKKDLIIRSKSIPIMGDFKLFLYTDGITEVHDKDINEFGSERIIQVLKQDHISKGEDILFNIFSEASDFGSENGLEDDITMIYIRSI